MISGIEQPLLIGALLTIASVLTSKLSSRLGVPALVLFLAVGMVAGSEGLLRIHFDDPATAQNLGIVALIYILFAGGLQTEWRDARSVAFSGLALSTLGVALTAVTLGGFAWAVLDLDPLVALMLGGIVSSTDAAAVFATFAGHGVLLKGRLRPLLELESGSNDPMAVFLTLGFVSALTVPGTSLLDMAPEFVRSMLVGALAGIAMSVVCVYLINRVRLDVEGLYPVLTLALAPLVYAISSMLGGNGFLSVYLAGVLIARQDLIHKHTLVQFHDGLAWLMQISMFVALGLLVFPSHLVPVVLDGLLVAGFLLFVARPLSVFLVLAPSTFTLREKALVSWVGLRGAVPIVLATFPLLAGVEEAEMLFNLVFFVVLTSALVQGGTLVPVARLLDLAAPPPAIRPVEPAAVGRLIGQLEELTLPDDTPVHGCAIVDVGIPRRALILLIFRGEGFVLPRGATVLEAGDRLMVLAQRDALEELARIVGARESAS